MGNLTQAQLEALYSRRSKNPVMYETIKFHLDGFLLMWSLRTTFALFAYLGGSYYESKDRRVAELRNLIDKEGLDYFLVNILKTVISNPGQVVTYQAAMGHLANYMPHSCPFDNAKSAGELLALGASSRTGMYTIVPREGRMSIVECNQWPLVIDNILNEYQWINATEFNPPLIEPPQQVVNNYSAGYHTIREPVVLGRFTNLQVPQNLNAINQLNSIPWRLDYDVCAEPELPKEPFESTTEMRTFEHMVFNTNALKDMLKDRTFYFAWQYDQRGRSYSHGYHINFQASEYKKAMLNFGKPEYLTT